MLIVIVSSKHLSVFSVYYETIQKRNGRKESKELNWTWASHDHGLFGMWLFSSQSYLDVNENCLSLYVCVW